MLTVGKSYMQVMNLINNEFLFIHKKYIIYKTTLYTFLQSQIRKKNTFQSISNMYVNFLFFNSFIVVFKGD